MRRKTFSGLILIVLLTGILTSTINIQPVKAEPKTWTVDDDGPADFHTIQEAVNAANDGDTIFIKVGIYYEHVVVNKSISLIGENRSTTIVNGNGEGTIVLVEWHIAANISGFTIQNGETGLNLYVAGECILRNNSLENSRYNLVITNNLSFKFEETGLIQDIDSSNTVNGKSIHYWMNERDKQIPNDAGFVALVNSTNIAIRNLKLTDNGYGLLMAWTNNSIIENVTTSNNEIGIGFFNCHNNNVYNNSAISNLLGVCLWASGNNTLKHTNITGNEYNFGMVGYTLSDHINDIDLSNTVNGKPIYYIISQRSLVIDSSCGEVGYLGIVNCTNVIVRDINLTGNQQGLLFAYTNTSLIEHVKIFGNYWGIVITCSSKNVIESNTIVDNGDGIWLYSLEEWAHGAYACTTGNIIRGNTIQGNGWGISTLYVPTFNNAIYHNDFINSTYEHTDIRLGSINLWDDGYPSGGNYWSDYNGTDLFNGQHQNETGSDGIGDTPYIIDINNIDRYPLMKPYAGPHDVGIRSFETSKTVVGQGYNVNMTAAIINYGEQTETFNLTIQANSTTLYTLTQTLTSRNSTTVTFTWNTTGWAKGNYTISANATAVPGETDTADNEYVDGWVVVTIAGDIDGDGDVDYRDLFILARAYGSSVGQTSYIANADLNGDGKIDYKDLFILARNYGKET